MTNKPDARDWFTSMAGQRVTAVKMAEIVGISRNSMNTRLKDGLSSDDLITISRGLGISPIHALVELGKLTHEEVLDLIDSDGTMLATATQEQLIYQLAEEGLSASSKIELGAAAKALMDAPTLPVNITKLIAVSDGHDKMIDDGTVTDWDDSIAHAADSSEDETQKRLERGEDLID